METTCDWHKFHQKATFMANRIRATNEKVKPVRLALRRINVEAVAREAGVPASTLRYDLDKVKQALADVLKNRTPGPKPGGLSPQESSTAE